MLRLFGIPESEIAETLRAAEHEGVELERLEITTCLRRGEIEVVTRYEPDADGGLRGVRAVVRERHADTLFSEDGSSVDEQVATSAGRRRAGCRRETAPEACTARPARGAPDGAARAASDYVRGGIVAYSERGEGLQAGVPAS